MEWGVRGANGIGNADFAPAVASGEALWLRNGDFAPGKGLGWVQKGVLGLGNREIDPARPAERAQWIKNGDLEPEIGLGRG